MLPFGRTESGLNASAVSTFHRIPLRLGSQVLKGTPLLALRCIPLGGSKLRMPIFSYFLVVGSVLTGLLLWFGNENEPIGPALTSSQTVGVPKFKPQPEAEHARATAVNFAAEYKHSKRKSLKAAEMPPRQKTTTNYSKPQPLGHFAKFPHDNLSIH